MLRVMGEDGLKTLTLVVPCHNEALVLEAFVSRCDAVAADCPGYRFVYLFVDDGSTDDTWERLVALAREDVRVRAIRLSRNYEQQRAIAAGLDHCEGDCVAILDADLQDPPELLPQMLARIAAGADIVHAVRGDRSSDSAFKRWTAWGFYRLMRRWVLPELPENAGDFKLFNRQVLDAVRQYRERVRFLRGNLATVGFRQETMVYARPPRHAGVSKYPLRRMLRLARDAVFSNTALPLRWCTYTGAGVVALWPVVCVAALAMEEPSVVLLLLLMQWLLMGLLMVGVGLAGEYFKVILLEVKQRPLYLVRDCINVSIAPGIGPAA